MKMDIIESKALRFGVAINLIMAIAGWITYYYSNSEALLLDGNYSFIAAIATLSAIIIIKRRHIKTSIYPFGSYFYESFFVLLKGVMIFAITTVALIQNAVKIIDYLNGEAVARVNIGPVLYYVILMMVLCFGLGFYYKSKNNQIDNKSSILSVESQASVIDGFLTLGVGIALLLASIIPLNSPLDFLLYIGDAIIVLILCLLLIKAPLRTIKEAFIELSGGVLQDKKSKEQIEEVITKHLSPEFNYLSNYINKMGSSYFVILYITAKSELVNVARVEAMKEEMLNALIPTFHTIDMEIIIKK